MNSITLSACYEDLRLIGPWLESVADPDRFQLANVELALQEIACNVVDHAYPEDGQLHVSADVGLSGLMVEVSDKGRPFQPRLVTVELGPGRLQEGGFGLSIAQQLTRELTYRRDYGQNIWTLVFD